MAKKNNIRSIRFSDELNEMIDRQVGDNFTQKFENLITRCMYELPEKEKQIRLYDEEIKIRQEQLKKLSTRAKDYSERLDNLKDQLVKVAQIIKKMDEL